jgi:hypothetical protein
LGDLSSDNFVFWNVNTAELPDLFLQAVVARHRVDTSPGTVPFRIRKLLLPCLRRWAGRNLESVSVSGSYAKNTAIRSASLLPGEFDVDLFLSLAPESFADLQEMHSSLAVALGEFNPQPRNVATRIYVDGLSVDLVPGRRRVGSHVHSLWQLRFSTWIQTNVSEQIRYVRESGCVDDILALYIWRRRHALKFPGFLLELAAIRALSSTHGSIPSVRFLYILRWLAEDFPTARLTDPGNSNNIVSELLDPEEKARIANTAAHCLTAADWSTIL